MDITGTNTQILKTIKQTPTLSFTNTCHFLTPVSTMICLALTCYLMKRR